jgi:hypothetical protein
VRPCEFVPLPIAPGNCAMHADNYRRTREGGIPRGRLLPDSARRAAARQKSARFSAGISRLTFSPSGNAKDRAALTRQPLNWSTFLAPRVYLQGSLKLLLVSLMFGSGPVCAQQPPSIYPSRRNHRKPRQENFKKGSMRPSAHSGKAIRDSRTFPTTCSRARRICIGQYAVCAAS